MENQIRDIVVFVDWPFGADLIIAVLAEVFTVIFVNIFVVDERVAAIAAGVVSLAAGSAQKAVAVSFIVLQVNAGAAFITKSCQPGSTMPAQAISFYQQGFFEREFLSAVVTNVQFLHFEFLL